MKNTMKNVGMSNRAPGTRKILTKYWLIDKMLHKFGDRPMIDQGLYALADASFDES